MRAPRLGDWDDHEKFILGIFGDSGTGKTTYARKFLQRADATCRFFFDPDAEFQRKFGLRPCYTPEDIKRAVSTRWVCYDPTGYPGHVTDAFVFFTSVVYELAAMIPGRKFLVIDELQDHCDGNSVPDPLQQIVQKGRRRGLDSVFMSQAPNLLHNTVRSQLSEVVTFQIVDPRAGEWLWKSAFRFRQSEVSSLRRFHWIARTKAGGEARGK